MMEGVQPDTVDRENPVATSPPGQPSIVGPLPCVKCLYDLNGLGQDQKCPECGTPIRWTLGSIATATPEAIAKLRRGLRWVALPMILGPLWLIGSQAIGMTFTFGGMGSSIGELFWLIRVYSLPVVSNGLTVLSAIGWVTTRRALIAAGMSMPPHMEWLPLLAWLFPVLYLIMEIGPALLLQVMPTFYLGIWIGTVLYSLTLLSWILRTVVGFRLICALSVAFDQRRLARVMHVFVWIAAVCGVTGMTAGLALALGGFSGLEYLGALCVVCYVASLFGLAVSVLLVRRRLGPFLPAARERAAKPVPPVAPRNSLPVHEGA